MIRKQTFVTINFFFGETIEIEVVISTAWKKQLFFAYSIDRDTKLVMLAKECLMLRFTTDNKLALKLFDIELIFLFRLFFILFEDVFSFFVVAFLHGLHDVIIDHQDIILIDLGLSGICPGGIIGRLQ